MPNFWRRRVTAFAMFVLLAAVHTWPLAADPAHYSRNDNGDALLNTWAIAWVAHQLPRDPLHLFDANIFYPERHTLGYSEAMIVQGVLAMPILAAGGSPVLAFNLVLLAGFALTGWAFWLLTVRWTGSAAAGYVSGSLAAFNAHVLLRLPHLQTQHVEFVPLMLFAADATIVSRRTRQAVLFGVAFALQALTSVYLLVFTTWMLVFAVAGRAREWLRQRPVQLAALFALAAGTAVLILSPYLSAYAEVHRLLGRARTVADAQTYAGTWLDYLATGGRLHYALWSEPFVDRARSNDFPGFTAVALTLFACVRRETRRNPRLRMCVVAAIGCLLVAFAPNAPFYPWLHRAIPLFQAVRVASNLGQIVLLMIAVAAGFGAAALLATQQTPRARAAVGVLLIVLVNVEALRAPIGYEPFAGIPRVYGVLARQPGAVVLEMPLWPPDAWARNAPYMLYSTRHWRPMVNGYSGFRPASYDDIWSALQQPAADAVAALRARGITHVVVHRDRYGEDFLDAITHLSALQLVADQDNVQIYRLIP